MRASVAIVARVRHATAGPAEREACHGGKSIGGTGGAGGPGGPQAYAMSLTMTPQLGLRMMDDSGTPRITHMTSIILAGGATIDGAAGEATVVREQKTPLIVRPA